MNTPYATLLRFSIACRVASLLLIAAVAGPRLVAAADADPSSAPPVRVLVWDEQQPAQKKVYPNFLGNEIADYLRKQPGLAVRSVRLDDPGQGVDDELLGSSDVLVWWGHQRHKEILPETGKRIVERIKAGKLSLVALHSAHWSEPFVQAMREKTLEEALKPLTPDQRSKADVEITYPTRFAPVKRDDPLTPMVKKVVGADGVVKLDITMPGCIFPAWRADGQPSHVTTLLPDHPIARGIPKQFDVSHTEMYDEPFHVPTPDALIFEEHWDKGEHFRSGMLWNVGEGKVFYFRPGHEVYPVYKEALPLKIVENAVRYLAAELPANKGQK